MLFILPTFASSTIGFHTLVAVLMTLSGMNTEAFSPSCIALSRLGKVNQAQKDVTKIWPENKYIEMTRKAARKDKEGKK